MDEIMIRLPLSLEVAIGATGISTIIAVPLGTLAAVRQDTWVDYVVRVVSIGGLAIPSFWAGILIILFLVIYFDWALKSTGHYSLPRRVWPTGWAQMSLAAMCSHASSMGRALPCLLALPHRFLER
jgi:ABC-type dipeptide/oligopeptide/nickel transport system permease component